MKHWDVLLVRHGESEANVAGKFAVRTWDPHLTEKGRAQAQQLVPQLNNVPIRYMVTSPLARAQETIGPLAKHRGASPVVLDGLAEVDLGEWDGQCLADLAESSDSYRAWLKDPDKFPPPGGETIRAVGKRVLSVLEDFFQDREPGFTVATTHADCVKGVLMVILEVNGPATRRLFVPNTGQLLLRRTASGRWIVAFPPLALSNAIDP